MGYEVHVTRRELWWDEDGPEIALEEWVDLVREDQELRLDGFAEARTPAGATIRIDDPSMTVWTGFSGHDANGVTVWLMHSHGRIVAKNPHPEILQKLWQIAQTLSARVQGDDGEFYGPDGEMLVDPVAVEDLPGHVIGEEGPTPKPSGKPWWRFW